MSCEYCYGSGVLETEVETKSHLLCKCKKGDLIEKVYELKALTENKIVSKYSCSNRNARYWITLKKLKTRRKP